MRCSAHTTEHSDFLPPIPPHFVSFARWYRRCALGCAPAGARRSTRGPGVVHRIPRTGSSTETTGAPRFLDGPPYERAVLSDPGRTSALGHYRASISPSTFSTVSASATIVISGLNHTARNIRCLRFAAWIAPSPPKTRFRTAGRPFRTGWLPAGSKPKGFRSSHPPFPGLAWRTGNDRSAEQRSPGPVTHHYTVPVSSHGTYG